jgi:hypothetical protein
MTGEAGGRRRARACLLASAAGDGDHAGIACNFDVIARGSRIKARALQPHVVAHTAEGLIVEDKLGDPALEFHSDGDACRAPNGNLRCSPADPYGDYARGRGEIQADHAKSSRDLQPGEIETAQFGNNLRCSALDHDPPWDGDAERDLRCALLPAQAPQTSWIADGDRPLFGLHIR